MKDLQGLIKTKKSIIIRQETNIRELSTYTKRETAAGNLTYQSETGNDDTVTSLLGVSTLIDNLAFKDLIDNYIMFNLEPNIRSMIESQVALKDDGTVPNYETMSNIHGKIYKKPINPYQKVYPKTNWGKPNYMKTFIPRKLT